MVARTGTPTAGGAQRQELDRERRRRPVVAGVLGALRRSCRWRRRAGTGPDRSPLTSAISTGTPAADSCSAITCSDFVLPVPVAPATRPCRLTVASGMRTCAVGSTVAVDDDGAEFQRLAFDGVTGGDLLGGGRLSTRCVIGLEHYCGRRRHRRAGCGRPVCRPDVGLLLSAVRDELVWIDCEMTGLDLESDRLIEIAVLVTDAELNILGDGVDVVIHADDAALSAMIDVVTKMHARSGLIDEVRASTIDVPTAEAHGAGLHPHPRQAGQDGAAGRQLDRHRPRLHRPRHARRWTTTCTTG